MLYTDFKNIWEGYMELRENIIKYTNEKYIKDLNKKALYGYKSEYFVNGFTMNHNFTKIFVWVEDAFKPSHISSLLEYEIDIEDFLDYVNGVK